MGAMIYGGVSEEHIQLNEQTLWSGAPREWNNPHAKQYLPLVRAATLAGEYRKADSLAKFMQGPYTESYMPMADLYIRYPSLNDSTDYRRGLRLGNATSSVQFSSGLVTYTRSLFASFPDKVIVLQQTATKKAAISFTAKLTSKLHFTIKRLDRNRIELTGKCPSHVEPAYLWKLPMEQAVQYAATPDGEGMNFTLQLLILNEGGNIYTTDSTIVVERADKVTMLLAAATSYNGYDQSPGLHGIDPTPIVRTTMAKAEVKTYSDLLSRHVRDYSKYFSRFQLYLGESKNKTLSTDERLRAMKDYMDPELVATIVSYGRYLLIAGSRQGGQPVNLKGIWNDRLRPEYSSNWCIDHDAQMFYYAVETSNLSEMHLPFLQFIEDLSVNGSKTAAINYGMRGWCAHHNADIWRQSGPVGNWGSGNPHWANWNMSGPWLSAHLFDHYLFTGDKRYLREKAWPVMKGAVEFCLDWLRVDEKGQWISAPSVSPENTFITAANDTAEVSINSTSDIALMKQLFLHAIETLEILQSEKQLLMQLREAIKKFPSYKIGSKGQLLEWSQEWASVDPAHRHLSHMYPVFPGDEISPTIDETLSNAAKKALSLREKTNCSWGFAWKAACWARLGEGDSAWQTWQYQLRYVDPRSTTSINNYGLFPNLFNSDGRDVIMNGNGCATAVMTEMLLQSHTGAIQFLPALPSVFPEGTAKGLVARSGFVVDLTWKEGRLQSAWILSRLGNECKIHSTNQPSVSLNGKPVALKSLGNDFYSFNTSYNMKYLIRIKNKEL